VSYTQEELDLAVKKAVREEQERCLVQVDREKGTWHFTGCSRAVRTALDNVKAMIRGEV
jgi:hypothetical protein